MMRVKDFALLLMFACVVQQCLQVNSVKDEGRAQQGVRGRKRGPRNEIGPKASSGTGAHRGEVSVKDGAQCAWVATGEGDKFVLGVTCKNRGKSFNCEYVAKPTACQHYLSNAKAYWRQIARSLKKQETLCRDSKAMVKAGVCRNAPREAHFRMTRTRSSPGVPSTASGPPPVGNVPCPGRIDRLKVAEEYCTSSWSSVCTFLFMMVENDEC